MLANEGVIATSHWPEAKKSNREEKKKFKLLFSIFERTQEEKQRKGSHKSRVEREFCLHNLENREEKENYFENLTNREENENFCLKILKIEKRKWIILKNITNREDKENFGLKILKIEKRKRNENTILQLEREKYESFLLEIFSRSRLLSMTGPQRRLNFWMVKIKTMSKKKLKIVSFTWWNWISKITNTVLQVSVHKSLVSNISFI